MQFAKKCINPHMQLRVNALSSFLTKGFGRELSLYILRIILLLDLTVAVHEAVNTTCCINELALTCVEWV